MKKEAVLIMLAFLLLVSSVSAVEISLTKESYMPGETLQGEIEGIFPNGLSAENIFFYRERNIPVEYDLIKLGNKYIFYALLPQKEGNYTMKIKNALYETDTGISNEEIVKEFTISSLNQTNKTIISFNPGFIVAKDDFYIIVKSSENTIITTTFMNETQAIPLTRNIEKKVYFSISGITNYTETSIQLQEYSIPVLIFPKSSAIPAPIEESNLRFNPLEITAVLMKSELYSFSVALINFGEENLSNILLEYPNASLNVGLSSEIIPELESKEREFVNITFSSAKEGNFSGEIIASAENYSAELHYDFQITEDRTKVDLNNASTYTEDKTCSELNGKVCGADEVCSIPIILTTDGSCCKGECNAKKKEGSSTWIYGIIILLVVAAGLFLFWLRMRKQQRKPMDILKAREKRFQERMSGKSGEVKESLTKV